MHHSHARRAQNQTGSLIQNNRVACFEDHEINSGMVEGMGGRETDGAAANDDHFEASR
jgi:hypothetical protein